MSDRGNWVTDTGVKRPMTVISLLFLSVFGFYHSLNLFIYQAATPFAHLISTRPWAYQSAQLCVGCSNKYTHLSMTKTLPRPLPQHVMPWVFQRPWFTEDPSPPVDSLPRGFEQRTRLSIGFCANDTATLLILPWSMVEKLWLTDSLSMTDVVSTGVV